MRFFIYCGIHEVLEHQHPGKKIYFLYFYSQVQHEDYIANISSEVLEQL